MIYQRPVFFTQTRRDCSSVQRVSDSDKMYSLQYNMCIVVVVRSKAINHLHLAMVLMNTVGLSSLFSFILRTHLAYDVSTNLELAS